jgi:hypothetical protein
MGHLELVRVFAAEDGRSSLDRSRRMELLKGLSAADLQSVWP